MAEKKSSSLLAKAEAAEKSVKKPAVKAAVKTTAKSSSKTSASVKSTVKAATKAPAKTAAKPAVKTDVKAAVKTSTSAKTTSVSKKSAPVQANAVYDENSIQHLEGLEHIRLRPGMYIGSLGDGSNENDGIYILFKEGIDNSVDEFSQGYGKKIDIEIKDGRVKIRDYGRGIPLGALEDCVANVNTGAKYNNSVFKQAIGMNGVGIKATKALSSYFRAASIRDGNFSVLE